MANHLLRSCRFHRAISAGNENEKIAVRRWLDRHFPFLAVFRFARTYDRNGYEMKSKTPSARSRYSSSRKEGAHILPLFFSKIKNGASKMMMDRNCIYPPLCRNQYISTSSSKQTPQLWRLLKVRPQRCLTPGSLGREKTRQHAMQQGLIVQIGYNCH
jgi:hypothetical protein